MNSKPSTRRAFFSQAGAALSAPLAVTAAVADDGDGLATRLRHFEDMSAIRALNEAYARHVNAGAHDEAAKLFAVPAEAHVDAAVRHLSTHGFGGHDEIEIADDGETATARIPCTVRIEIPIEPSCTLVDMARQQGGGILRRSEQRVLENAYVRRRGAWKIARSAYRSA